MKHFFHALLATAAIVCLPKVASAVPLDSAYPAAPRNSNPVCYMNTAQGATIDLTKLCGLAASPTSVSVLSANTSSSSSVPLSGSYASGSSGSFRHSSGSSGSSGSFSRSSGSSGTCLNPDDRASDGSRCGDRAASVRSGGGSGSSSTPGADMRSAAQQTRDALYSNTTVPRHD